jgi:hypothetical protein
LLVIAWMASRSAPLNRRSIMLRNIRVEMVGLTLDLLTLLVVMPGVRADDKVTEDEAHKIGVDAYIYGYPARAAQL